MRIAILDAFEDNHLLENSLKKILNKNGQTFDYFKLKDMNIERCAGCGACGIKTPGKCVINDDMQQIFKALARSETIILVCRLTFGGYSALLKKAVDRFMPLGLPLYFVKDGRLFHPGRYGNKYYVGIAVAEEKLQGQEENYDKIVRGNALNLQFIPKTLIFKYYDKKLEFEEELNKFIKELSDSPAGSFCFGKKGFQNNLNKTSAMKEEQ